MEIGRTATTHWRDAERLSRDYPAVQVNPDVLYVDDGQVLTSAGIAAISSSTDGS